MSSVAIGLLISISIQALYDYKGKSTNYNPCRSIISIQALYDYKAVQLSMSTRYFHFNSSIVRL